MALDSAVAVKWVIATLNADSATLGTLIAGGKAYRDVVPADVDVRAKPGIAVSLYSTNPPLRPLRRGNQTQVLTRLTVKTKIVQRAASYSGMEAAVSRVLALLDGQYYAETPTGTMYQCVQGQDAAFETDENGERYKNIEVFWTLAAKAD